MPAIHMSKKELVDLINAGKAAGNDTSLLENFLAELPSEKAARTPPPVAVRRIESERVPEELVTGPELERLRVLACPHIRSYPYSFIRFILPKPLARAGANGGPAKYRW